MAICCAAAAYPAAAAAKKKVKPGKTTATVVAPGSATVGATITLRVTVKPARGQKVTGYTLDFGDGTKAAKGKKIAKSGTELRHAFGRPGRFTVKLTVLSGKRKLAKAKTAITIARPPVVPTTQPRPTVPVVPFAGSTGSPKTPPPYVPPPLPGGGPGRPQPPPYDIGVGLSPLSLPPGSSSLITTPEPFKSIETIDPLLADVPAAISATVESQAIVLTATTSATPVSVLTTLTGTGCTDDGCGKRFGFTLYINVVPLAAPAGYLNDFTAPSPDREQAAIPLSTGGATLRDELLVTLGTPDSPGTREQADAVAAAVGASVSGGIADLGVFELRWTTPQDLGARRTQLLTLPGVTAVSNSQIGTVDVSRAPPGDWSDDGPQATWPFEQVGAEGAWDDTQGTDVTVGIVDRGAAFKDHEDLDVSRVLQGSADTHSTHVAGLACARANGIGLVGMAWGCPVVSSGWGDGSDKGILKAANEMVSWTGVRVVNMSLGSLYDGSINGKCLTGSQADALRATANNSKQLFRTLLESVSGRGVVWTVSAGNYCAPGALSPWGANADLPNVISVAATNSDRSLASFSNFGGGVEVAAPGGVSVSPTGNGTVGVWSTWVNQCGIFGWFACGTYKADYGTSMAAPVVAGIVALVRSEHPGYSAGAAAECLTATAGKTTGVVSAGSGLPAGFTRHVAYAPATLPIVDANAAVACDTLDSTDESQYLGRFTGAGWIIDVAEESPGVLGLTNRADTMFVNGCVIGPPLKLLTGLRLAPSGQWNGQSVTTVPDCSSTAFTSTGAIRLARDWSGTPHIVVAWGGSPTIAADGTVSGTSAQAHLYRSTQGAGSAFARKSPAPKRSSANPPDSGAIAPPTGP